MTAASCRQRRAATDSAAGYGVAATPVWCELVGYNGDGGHVASVALVPHAARVPMRRASLDVAVRHSPIRSLPRQALLARPDCQRGPAPRLNPSPDGSSWQGRHCTPDLSAHPTCSSIHRCNPTENHACTELPATRNDQSDGGRRLAAHWTRGASIRAY